MNSFTPTFQFWSVIAALGLFSAAAYFTRATLRRLVGAFAGAIVFTGLNIPWDLLAHAAGWWRYPHRAGALVPIPVYFAQDLVWGGASLLICWRIERRFGLRTLAVFLLLLSAVASARDFHVASMTQMIAFGPGAVPRLADYACWATLLAAAFGTMRVIVGSSHRDVLAREPDVLRYPTG